MKYRTMGKLGIQSSAFGLGCMRFNGPASGDSIIDEQKAISLIRQAIDGGVTYLDTAYVYLDKTSETVLGKALLDGYRDKVTIATKVPPEAVQSRAGASPARGKSSSPTCTFLSSASRSRAAAKAGSSCPRRRASFSSRQR